MPPIGNFLGVIIVSIVKNIDMASLTIGFALIVIQTLIMTSLNSYLLIKSLSASVEEISAAIDQLNGTVQQNMENRVSDESMKKTSASMEELTSRMEYFFRMVNVIGTASKEQAQNIGELSNAITQIDTSTQTSASTVEELASVLDNLRSEAVVLAENVNKFKVTFSE